MAARPRVHLWLPDIEATRGGIQTYCADFLRALRALWPDAQCDVFLKNDRGIPSGFQDEDIRFHVAGRWPLRLRSAVYAASTVGRALRDRPTLVVAGHLHFAGLAQRVHRMTGAPYWILTYGLEAWGVEDPSTRRALRGASRILSISRTTADRLAAEHGLVESRVDLLPCTFDPSRFRPSGRPRHLLDRHGLRQDQPVILTVARLAGRDRHKGYDLVLDALPHIRSSSPDVRYVLVGEGEDRPRLEDRIRASGLEDVVTLAGAVPSEELPDYYNLSDLFVMPSKREGFGIVYLEAMSCGKPSIGGSLDGARDALLEGELGVLVDPDDPVAFAETTLSILAGRYPNPILYHPEDLRRRAIEEFGPDRFRARLRAMLEQDGHVAAPSRRPA